MAPWTKPRTRPLPADPSRFLVALAWVGVVLLLDVSRANPCVDGTYRAGEPVPIGVAYWPGGLEVNWTGLHPCRPEDRDLLASEGVQIAFFKPSVDKLTFLRSTKEEEDALMASIPGDKPDVLTLVAFHGRTNLVRSEARTIRSLSSNATTGTGTVPSLILIMILGACPHRRDPAPSRDSPFLFCATSSPETDPLALPHHHLCSS